MRHKKKQHKHYLTKKVSKQRNEKTTTEHSIEEINTTGREKACNINDVLNPMAETGKPPGNVINYGNVINPESRIKNNGNIINHGIRKAEKESATEILITDKGERMINAQFKCENTQTTFNAKERKGKKRNDQTNLIKNDDLLSPILICQNEKKKLVLSKVRKASTLTVRELEHERVESKNILKTNLDADLKITMQNNSKDFSYTRNNCEEKGHAKGKRTLNERKFNGICNDVNKEAKQNKEKKELKVDSKNVRTNFFEGNCFDGNKSFYESIPVPKVNDENMVKLMILRNTENSYTRFGQPFKPNDNAIPSLSFDPMLHPQFKKDKEQIQPTNLETINISLTENKELGCDMNEVNEKINKKLQQNINISSENLNKFKISEGTLLNDQINLQNKDNENINDRCDKFADIKIMQNAYRSANTLDIENPILPQVEHFLTDSTKLYYDGQSVKTKSDFDFNKTIFGNYCTIKINPDTEILHPESPIFCTNFNQQETENFAADSKKYKYYDQNTQLGEIETIPDLQRQYFGNLAKEKDNIESIAEEYGKIKFEPDIGYGNERFYISPYESTTYNIYDLDNHLKESYYELNVFSYIFGISAKSTKNKKPENDIVLNFPEEGKGIDFVGSIDGQIPFIDDGDQISKFSRQISSYFVSDMNMESTAFKSNLKTIFSDYGQQSHNGSSSVVESDEEEIDDPDIGAWFDKVSSEAQNSHVNNLNVPNYSFTCEKDYLSYIANNNDASTSFHKKEPSNIVNDEVIKARGKFPQEKNIYKRTSARNIYNTNGSAEIGDFSSRYLPSKYFNYKDAYIKKFIEGINAAKFPQNNYRDLHEKESIMNENDRLTPYNEHKMNWKKYGNNWSNTKLNREIPILSNIYLKGIAEDEEINECLPDFQAKNVDENFIIGEIKSLKNSNSNSPNKNQQASTSTVIAVLKGTRDAQYDSKHSSHKSILCPNSTNTVFGTHTTAAFSDERLDWSNVVKTNLLADCSRLENFKEHHNAKETTSEHIENICNKTSPAVVTDITEESVYVLQTRNNDPIDEKHDNNKIHTKRETPHKLSETIAGFSIWETVVKLFGHISKDLKINHQTSPKRPWKKLHSNIKKMDSSGKGSQGSPTDDKSNSIP